MNIFQKTSIVLIVLGIVSRVILVWVPQCAPCGGEICIAICNLYLPYMILNIGYKAFLILGAVLFVIGHQRNKN